MSGELTQKVISYVRPREKAQKKGISALSDVELLQLVIGSGTLHFNVVKIARKLSRLMSEYGGQVSPDLLKEIPGLGPARVSQLLAMFELGARFPNRKYSEQLKSPNEVAGYARSLRVSANQLWLITLDGSRHVIEKRLMKEVPLTLRLRELCTALIKDNADHVICVRLSTDEVILPTMDDLSMARDVRQLVRTLGVSSLEYLVVNQAQHYSIMKEVARAD